MVSIIQRMKVLQGVRPFSHPSIFPTTVTTTATTSSPSTATPTATTHIPTLISPPPPQSKLTSTSETSQPPPRPRSGHPPPQRRKTLPQLRHTQQRRAHGHSQILATLPPPIKVLQSHLTHRSHPLERLRPRRARYYHYSLQG